MDSIPARVTGPFGPDDIARYHDGDVHIFDTARSSVIRRFFDYWCVRRQGRAMPKLRDMDPVDFPWALPVIYVGDYDREADAFVYRVSGEDVTDVFSRYNGRRNMRGVALGDGMPADKAALIRKRWRPVSERGDLIYMSGTVYLAAERYGVGERLVLPLSENGETVTGFVGLTVCDWMSQSFDRDLPGLDIWYVALGDVPPG